MRYWEKMFIIDTLNMISILFVNRKFFLLGIIPLIFLYHFLICLKMKKWWWSEIRFAGVEITHLIDLFVYYGLSTLCSLYLVETYFWIFKNSECCINNFGGDNNDSQKFYSLTHRREEGVESYFFQRYLRVSECNELCSTISHPYPFFVIPPARSSLQHVVFSRSHLSTYWPDSMLLNFTDPTKSGVSTCYGREKKSKWSCLNCILHFKTSAKRQFCVRLYCQH